eukprot:c10641_g1_i1.p1 GENE.c10641_g1_i1~~c10641_g1_i1.p1  ORF type:complete len:966 (+),score=337.84 c10641_g1_i1:182-3079(+)
MTDKKDELTSTIQVLQQQSLQTKKHMEALKAELDQKNRELSNLRVVVETVSGGASHDPAKHHERLISAVGSEARAEILEVQIKATRDQLALLTDHVTSLRSRLAAATERESSLRNQIVDLHSQLENANAAKQQALDQAEETTTAQLTLADEITALKTTAKTIQELSAQFEKDLDAERSRGNIAEETARKSNSQVAQLQGKLDATSNQLEELSRKESEQAKLLESASIQIATLTSSLKLALAKPEVSLDSKSASPPTEKQQRQTDVNAAVEMAQQFEKQQLLLQIEQAVAENTRLAEKAQTVAKQLVELNSRLHEASNATAEAKLKELEALEARDAAVAKFDEQVTELEKFRTQLQSHTSQIDALKTAIEQKTTSESALRTEFEILKNKQLPEVSQQATALTAQLAISEAQTTATTDRIKVLLEGVTSDKDIIKKLRDETGTLTEKVKGLELQLEESRANEATLREQLKRMEEISKLVENRAATISERVASQREALSQRLEQTKSLFESLKQKEDALREKDELLKLQDTRVASDNVLITSNKMILEAAYESRETTKKIAHETQIELAKVKQERNVLEAMIEGLKDTILSLQEEIQTIRLTIASRDSRLALQHSNILVLQDSVRAATERTEIMQLKQVKNLEALKQAQSQSRENLSELVHTRMDNQKLRDLLEDKEHEMLRIQNELTTSENLRKALQQRAEVSGSSVNALVAMLKERLNENERALTTKRSELTAFERSVAAATASDDSGALAVEEQVSHLREQLYKAEVLARSKDSLIETLTVKADSAARDLLEKEEKLTQLQAELAQHRQLMAQKSAALSQANERVQLLSTENVSLLESLTQLQSSIKEGGDNGKLLQELQELVDVMREDMSVRPVPTPKSNNPAFAPPSAAAEVMVSREAEQKLARLFFQAVCLFVKSEIAQRSPSRFNNDAITDELMLQAQNRRIPYEDWPSFVLAHVSLERYD